MKKVSTVDEYLDELAPEVRVGLDHLRAVIKKAAPTSTEKISYNMPGFFDNGVICWMAAFKNHYALFFRPAVYDGFRDELSKYEMTKSSLHIPYGKKFPAALLTKMVKRVVAENAAKKKK